ncbi:hypothetical protein REMIM1_PE00581 (plasmid) [Rhizobium etli bv. mimosae str. Mim1]|nr:hypothetical protein REMIM1_PE00581 [Rhizobium etli bv. mimosae str. Mim1]
MGGCANIAGGVGGGRGLSMDEFAVDPQRAQVSAKCERLRKRAPTAIETIDVEVGIRERVDCWGRKIKRCASRTKTAG